MVIISGFCVGKVNIENPVVLAPMAGVTDRAFRELVFLQFPGLAYTEMISAMALLYANKRTFKMLQLESHRPLAVQLFGSEPEVMAKAAALVEEESPTWIDINMGCPTPKIIKNGEGSALMRTPDLAAQIVDSVASAVKVPVSVKIRAGWDEENITAPEFAVKMEAAGAQAIAVHGRTRSQFYSGTADWEVIREVADRVKIPVLGNGDITSVSQAEERLKTSGCAGVMIGRGALGNPWLISRARHYFAGHNLPPEPTYEERIETALEHLDRAVIRLGEGVAVPQMRKHLAWYLKGLPKAAEVKGHTQTVKSVKEVRLILQEYLKSLS